MRPPMESRSSPEMGIIHELSEEGNRWSAINRMLDDQQSSELQMASNHPDEFGRIGKKHKGFEYADHIELEVGRDLANLPPSMDTQYVFEESKAVLARFNAVNGFDPGAAHVFQEMPRRAADLEQGNTVERWEMPLASFQIRRIALLIGLEGNIILLTTELFDGLPAGVQGVVLDLRCGQFARRPVGISDLYEFASMTDSHLMGVRAKFRCVTGRKCLASAKCAGAVNRCWIRNRVHKLLRAPSWAVPRVF